FLTLKHYSFLYLQPASHARTPFPTRRSSDLSGAGATAASGASSTAGDDSPDSEGSSSERHRRPAPWPARHGGRRARPGRLARRRSEEHTSELQSRENLVCRLLLVEKKSGRVV